MIDFNEQLRNILVPLDFSDRSAQAVKVAERIAVGAADVKVHLLHVKQPTMAYAHAGGTVPPATSAPALPTLAELKSDLEKVGPAEKLDADQIKRVVEEGTPASKIIGYAQENGIDLIVMTTHGYTGLTRLLMGSVAEKVVRKAGCPVLTLSDHGSDES